MSVCSAFRDRPASGIRVRDERVTGRKAGGRLRQNRQQKMPICRMFSTGATGLEPATSGVTGRSWRFRPEWGLAGVPARAGLFDRAVAGIAGYGRGFPATSRGMPAGCARCLNCRQDVCVCVCVCGMQTFLPPRLDMTVNRDSCAPAAEVTPGANARSTNQSMCLRIAPLSRPGSMAAGPRKLGTRSERW
jgi:hypothetical protein